MRIEPGSTSISEDSSKFYTYVNDDAAATIALVVVVLVILTSQVD